MSLCRNWILPMLCAAATIRGRRTKAATICSVRWSIVHCRTFILSAIAVRADGKEPINGWANSPRIEELRAAWLDTADLEQQKRICVDLQKQLWEDVPFIPMGEYWQATAYRKDLTDVLPGCFALFYGVRRA